MCGIVGVLGNHEVAPLLVEALKRLEYRGYDSAGIATVNDGRLDRRRAVGKLVNLSDLLVHDPLAGKAGIGHTRWATHGAATVTNAHPHRAGPVAVVHNGIIENFRELRAELAAAGYDLGIRDRHRNRRPAGPAHMDRGLSPVEAARETLARLHGAFALCFLFDGEDDLMIAARKGSPLAIGHGDGEMFVGSDAIALAPMTDRITYLEEGDWAVVTRAGRQIFDAAGPARQPGRDPHPDRRDPHRKGRLQAFHGQGNRRAAGGAGRCAEALPCGRGHDAEPAAGVDFTGVDRADAGRLRHRLLRLPRREILVRTDSPACRSRSISPPSSATASRRCRPPPGRCSSASRARRPTRWPPCAMRATRWRKVVAVVNVPTSSIARESDLALPILAGVEVGVASTKAFTCQLTGAGAAGAEGGAGPRPARRREAVAPASRRPCAAARPDEPRARPVRPTSRRSPRNWPRRRTSCSSGAARCSRWRWKAR